jgi:vacuolar-type H+-ATPase subunit E/Vma4
MKAKPIPASHIEDAQAICSKIKEEAAYQISDILARAKKEADTVLNLTLAEVASRRDRVVKDADRHIARARDRILSTIALEKKKIVLDEKNKFAQEVLAQVKVVADEFRSSKEYASFLKRAILQGARVIDSERIGILYSPLDNKIITDDFMREAGAFVINKLKKNFVFTFSASDFSDIGVVMQSHDGRCSYDNRFSSRLKRIQDEVYTRLLKEAF